MKHFNDDQILKYALEVLEHDEERLINEHILKCEMCADKFNEIKADLKQLRGFDPKISEFDIPIPKVKKDFSVWIKRAAILAIGFATGYITSIFLQPNHINVIEQNLISRTPIISAVQFTPCQAVDIWQF